MRLVLDLTHIDTKSRSRPMLINIQESMVSVVWILVGLE